MKNLISRFNILAIITAGFIAASFKYPWWSMVFVGGWGDKRADIYPYIIAGELPELLGYRRTAQMDIIVPVLIGCIVLCLVASALRGKAGRIILALIGLLVPGILYAFVKRISTITAGYGIPIQGRGIGQIEIVQVPMLTQFQRGIYLLAIGGGLALLSSLLHPWLRIGGKPRDDKTNA